MDNAMLDTLTTSAVTYLGAGQVLSVRGPELQVRLTADPHARTEPGRHRGR